MPTYTEALFEPLEAWIEQEETTEGAIDFAALRLIVAKMLLEHAGRGDRPMVKS